MAIPSRKWRRWHRWAGLAAALPVAMLAVSGVLLNHAGSLGLNDRSLPRPLASLYGLPDAGPVLGTRAAAGWWLHAGEHLRAPAGGEVPCAPPFAGVARVEGVAVAGCGGELLLLDGDGQELERLGAAWGLPPFDRLGVTEQGTLVLVQGQVAKEFDLATFGVRPAPGSWAAVEVAVPPDAVALEVVPQVPAELSWERLLLDLHSGRLLGGAGVLLMDLAALLMLALAGTGVVIWSRTRP